MQTTILARTHLDYSAWASRRLVEAAGALTAEELTRDHGTADKSVLGTLAHIFAADRVWLKRVKGEAVTKFIDEADYSMDVLRNDWPAMQAEWLRWLDSLPEEGLNLPVEFSDMKGRLHSNSGWEVVQHVVNHGTHHRGQVSGFLRTMGHKPPGLDVMLYYRGR